MNAVYYDNLASDSISADALMNYLGIISIVFIIVAILQIVAMWKLFTKAGEKGWKSIIPIYNLITLFKIVGITPWLILAYLLVAIPVVGTIIALVLSIYLAYKVSKSFGHGIGMTIVAVLFTTIAYLIIGFGSSEYVGPGGNE